mgnify:CR=1 FL=1
MRESFSPQEIRYLKLLRKQYRTIQEASAEVAHLRAVLRLPKGTEHFLSDLHGEHAAFLHILHNASGVIKRKINDLYGDILSSHERDMLSTLIYYPDEKLALLKKQGIVNAEWYRLTIYRLLEVCRMCSVKYTRKRVRDAMPRGMGALMEEMLLSDNTPDKEGYYREVMQSILETGQSDAMIIALSDVIQALAIDRLHIIGDIYDRGAHADKIMDTLMHHHSLDIQWGNHDVLWMGAAAGNAACIANVLRNNIRYHNMGILESGYGISLRPFALFALQTYKEDDGMEPMVKAINVIVAKLEGQTIYRHPDYNMDDRLLFHKIDWEKGVITLDGKTYELKTKDFPTVNPQDPYTLSPEEHQLMNDIQAEFTESERLQRHIRFLYSHGSLYRCMNNNLLFHGGLPLNEDGSFKEIYLDGKPYKGKAFMDKAEHLIRRAYDQRDTDSLDYMWYLWCGADSPVSGRIVKTFERSYIIDESTWKEPQNAYYRLNRDKDECIKILHEFGIDSPQGHIINGHTPVKVKKGESPIRAEGKEICIDGGFCKAYQGSTGIAGYTLIFNSHGIRIKSHYPFEDVYQALMNNVDIDSESTQVELEPKRVMIGDTDNGKKLLQMIHDLKALLEAYRQGVILERRPNP